MHCQPEKKTPAIGPVQHAVDKDPETQVKRLTQGRDIASCLVPEKERESRSHAVLSKPFPIHTVSQRLSSFFVGIKVLAFILNMIFK